MHKGIVDRTISVWMIFTHCITDDTGTFSMWLVRRQSEFFHRLLYIAPMQRTSLDIEAIPIVSNRLGFFKEERGNLCAGGTRGAI